MSVKKDPLKFSKYLSNQDVSCIKRIMLDEMFELDSGKNWVEKKDKAVNQQDIILVFKENPDRINAIKKSCWLFLNPSHQFRVDDYQNTYYKKALKIIPMLPKDAKAYYEEKKNPPKVLKEYEIILNHAREAIIMAVSIFNDPSIAVKSEGFPIFCAIAWNRLLQAYSKRESINIIKANGEVQSLSYMIQQPVYNFSKAIQANIEKIIEIRNQIEHQYLQEDIQSWHMLYQASCLNFENKIIEWFGKKYSLAENLKFALQFSKLSSTQIVKNQNYTHNIEWVSAINKSIDNIDSDILQNTEYMFKVAYINVASSKGSADIAVRYISPDEADYQTVSDVLVKKMWIDGCSPETFIKKLKNELKNNGFNLTKKINTNWLNKQVLYPFKIRKERSYQSLNEKFAKYVNTGENSGSWQYSNDLIGFIVDKIKKNEISLPA